jgi:hypothetical protein
MWYHFSTWKWWVRRNNKHSWILHTMSVSTIDEFRKSTFKIWTQLYKMSFLTKYLLVSKHPYFQQIININILIFIHKKFHLIMTHFYKKIRKRRRINASQQCLVMWTFTVAERWHWAYIYGSGLCCWCFKSNILPRRRWRRRRHIVQKRRHQSRLHTVSTTGM